MKQTVTSKYEPKSKNVTWIDMSTGSPVLKNFINGMWRSVGSGGSSSGSGLPTVSAEDKGKVMQVVKAEKIGSHTETFDIIPELNVDPGEGIPYSNTDLTYFKEGNTVTMVATFEDGTTETYTNVVMYDDGSTFVGFNGEYMAWDWFFYEYEGHVLCDGFPEDVSVYIGSGHTVNIRLYTETEVPDYNYNWAPGVKIPIPTAEDEGKILVVTKTEGNSSIIVPEQPVPADAETPLTDVDLTKFVVGNTVKVTISANSETITETGVIEGDGEDIYYEFNIDDFSFSVWQTGNLLYTDAYLSGSIINIKLEYLEPNYEYQLQENSGGGSSTLKLIDISQNSTESTEGIELFGIHFDRIGTVGSFSDCVFVAEGKADHTVYHPEFEDVSTILSFAKELDNCCFKQTDNNKYSTYCTPSQITFGVINNGGSISFKASNNPAWGNSDLFNPIFKISIKQVNAY